VKPGWRELPLGDLLQVQNGFAFDSERFSVTDGVPLIRIRDLRSGKRTETNYAGPHDSSYLVHKGDYLIGMDGEFGCYEWKGDDALLNQRVCRLVNFNPALLPRYLFYGINEYLKEIEDATAFTTVKHLSSKQIKAIQLPVPPLAEQERIVAVLDEAFEAIATATANIERSIHVAERAVRLRSDNLFSEAAAQRGTVTLGSVARLENGDRGKNYPGKDARVADGVPFINAGHLDEGTIIQNNMDYISEERFALLSNGKVQSGDVLFCLRGSLGKHAFVEHVDQAAIASSLVIVRPRAGWSPRFVSEYFGSGMCKAAIAERAGGAAQPNLGARDLARFELPKLDPDEQAKVVTAAGELRRALSDFRIILTRKLSLLAQLKQSLLAHAFSGELTSEMLAA
jgi:type I restriction enzyme S subunit